ncbi:MAG: hypothetical protein B0D92_04390 [Spirochaeta sp. LUC14_002_19_P3]|nr:MAG: hypothetical protein B0D92_04390 [Spirochaeta sp. LUC14_002_19_P3]
MIEHLHDHIVEELKINTRTDTVFIITAIIFNLVLLAINTSIALGNKDMLLMMVFLLLVVVISIVSEVGLIRGKQARTRLLTSLIEIYEDNGIAKYYRKELIADYETRYNLFMVAILATSLISIIVPFLSMR